MNFGSQSDEQMLQVVVKLMDSGCGLRQSVGHVVAVNMALDQSSRGKKEWERIRTRLTDTAYRLYVVGGEGGRLSASF